MSKFFIAVVLAVLLVTSDAAVTDMTLATWMFGGTPVPGVAFSSTNYLDVVAKTEASSTLQRLQFKLSTDVFDCTGLVAGDLDYLHGTTATGYTVVSQAATTKLAVTNAPVFDASTCTILVNAHDNAALISSNWHGIRIKGHAKIKTAIAGTSGKAAAHAMCKTAGTAKVQGSATQSNSTTSLASPGAEASSVVADGTTTGNGGGTKGPCVFCSNTTGASTVAAQSTSTTGVAGCWCASATGTDTQFCWSSTAAQQCTATTGTTVYACSNVASSGTSFVTTTVAAIFLALVVKKTV